jgi:hypothetical protein
VKDLNLLLEAFGIGGLLGTLVGLMARQGALNALFVAVVGGLVALSLGASGALLPSWYVWTAP